MIHKFSKNLQCDWEKDPIAESTILDQPRLEPSVSVILDEENPISGIADSTEPRLDPAILDEGNGDVPADPTATLPHLLDHIRASNLPLELSRPTHDGGDLLISLSLRIVLS